MIYIDPHIHMVSRITDDYVRMGRAECVAVSEPALRIGFRREMYGYPITANHGPMDARS